MRKPQDYKERRSEDPDLGVSGEKSDERGGHGHDEDGQAEGACAPQTIADLPEEHASDGPHEIPGGENAERVDEARDRVVGGKELRADVRCEVAEDSEVVPLEEIADAASE